MPENLRWSERDSIRDALGPDLQTMEQSVSSNRLARSIDGALEELSGEGEMVGWAAVAIKREADGSTTTYVCGDPTSSDLEIKGYLHSAVWQAAHQEEGLAL